jgi:hypothetical protein
LNYKNCVRDTPESLHRNEVFTSGAESAVATSESAQGTQEIDAPKVGPQRLFEVKLGVGTLPEQKVADALFAGCTNDKIWVGLAARVQVLRNQLWGQGLG